MRHVLIVCRCKHPDCGEPLWMLGDYCHLHDPKKREEQPLAERLRMAAYRTADALGRCAIEDQHGTMWAIHHAAFPLGFDYSAECRPHPACDFHGAARLLIRASIYLALAREKLRDGDEARARTASEYAARVLLAKARRCISGIPESGVP